MNFRDYQTAAVTTAVFPTEVALVYTSLGLGNEAGEVQGKIKKFFRGDYDLETLQGKVKAELGDVLWYLAVLASTLKIDLDQVARENVAKLADRASRGVVKGDGDYR